MRITYRRRGGFSGLSQGLRLECDELPPGEAQIIQAALLQARFFELPAHLPAASEARDEFTYQLTVETEQRQHTVEFSDSSTPVELAPLLRLLSARARLSRL
ncbi:MAG: hypothetical protein PHD58_09815 [Anaerolineales bacterium]|nr:hypothetical protein [Anaerolineales bacterium]